VDEAPTKAAVQAAVEFWAKFKMNDIAAPLYVIMTNHGNSNDGIYLDTASITPSDINTWLNTLEAGLSAEALLKKRVVIVGACYSGAFIPAVSNSGRVVISSAAADEVSHKGPYEEDSGVELRSGEFFMEELFTYLGRGYTIKDAFVEATERTEIFTRRDSVTGEAAPYYDEAVQHPLLDDDGDGYGSNVLSDTGDGSEVEDMYLGVGSYYVPNNAENPADVMAVTETVYLAHDAGDNTHTMWAEVNDNAKVDGAMIWFEVRAPSKTLSGAGGNEQVVADYVYNFLLFDSGLRWENAYSAFNEYGRYEVFYFVRDLDSQKISPMKRSFVYKDHPGNANYPGAFNLVSPADGTEQMTSVILEWEESTDPDGDKVTYTVMVSTDNTFATTDYVRTNIKNTWALVEGLLVDTQYYWKVVAVDPYGKHMDSSQVWSFTTNCLDPSNCNGTELPGVITGHVYVTGTNPGVPIEGASIVTGDGRTATAAENGFFSISNHDPGSWSMTVTKTGYAQDPTGNVVVISLKVTEMDIYMTSQCTDNDSDGFGNPGASGCPNGAQTDCDDRPDGGDGIPGNADDGENIYPGAAELCDGRDNNCDASIDEGYTDTDSDGIKDCVDTDDDNDGIADGSDTCPLTMPAKIGVVEYPDIWTAYSNASTPDTIQCHDIIYVGDFTADRAVTVTIEGGYNCDYSAVTGVTTIQGDMTIDAGEVTIENIEVE
jgi:hypothetical protein